MTQAECEIIANIGMGLNELCNELAVAEPKPHTVTIANPAWAADLDRERIYVLEEQLRTAQHRVSYFIGALSALPLEAEGV